MKLGVINFLRGFAIFTIVVMHLVDSYPMPEALVKAFALGGAGVHVFIFCSGLGLYLSYLKKPLGYLDFLKKRFSRIYMPYAFCVAAWGLWYLFSSGLFPIREVMSHLFLYKMFSTELDGSLCFPYWFISTIIQFYLCWPLIVRLMKNKSANSGAIIALVISLTWSTVVAILGRQEERPWGSFFLQYLWEFCLGMWVADKLHTYRNVHNEWPQWVNVGQWKWRWILSAIVIGLGTHALMAWNGGVLKLYNDIPSLIGYSACALFVYKLGWKHVNSFFEWTNGFGYELYLLHMLVYVVIAKGVCIPLPYWMEFIVCFSCSYAVAWLYNRLWNLKTSK